MPGKREIAFRKFLKNVPVLTLPIKITPFVDFSGGQADGLPNVYSEPDDTLFFKLTNGASREVKGYGLLPDTANCFHVIVLEPFDIYQPFLVTYSKTGKEISFDILAAGNCDGSMDCTETIFIRNDYTVYSTDTNIDRTLDEQGLPIPGKAKISVIYRTGEIPHTGKPMFSVEREKRVE